MRPAGLIFLVGITGCLELEPPSLADSHRWPCASTTKHLGEVILDSRYEWNENHHPVRQVDVTPDGETTLTTWIYDDLGETPVVERKEGPRGWEERTTTRDNGRIVSVTWEGETDGVAYQGHESSVYEGNELLQTTTSSGADEAITTFDLWDSKSETKRSTAGMLVDTFESTWMGDPWTEMRTTGTRDTDIVLARRRFGVGGLELDRYETTRVGGYSRLVNVRADGAPLYVLETRTGPGAIDQGTYYSLACD